MLYIAICDDLSKDRVKLQEDIGAYFEERNEKALVVSFESGDELIAKIEDHPYHIVFMDVYMEGLSGVETSQRLRKLGKECAIIFTTTSPDHAMAGYEIRASDYLLKPFLREDVFNALDYAIEHIPKQQRSIEIVSDRQRVSLPIRDIEFIEVYGHECQIHMTSGKVFSTNQSLRTLEETVGDDFIRCHKSYLVNANRIQRSADGAFLLTNGEKVPIGAEQEKKSKQEFYEWSFHHTWGKL